MFGGAFNNNLLRWGEPLIFNYTLGGGLTFIHFCRLTLVAGEREQVDEFLLHLSVSA